MAITFKRSEITQKKRVPWRFKKIHSEDREQITGTYYQLYLRLDTDNVLLPTFFEFTTLEFDIEIKHKL